MTAPRGPLLVSVVCCNCRNPAEHAVVQTRPWIHLGPVAVIPLRTRRRLVCTYCRQDGPLTREDAERLTRAGLAQASMPALPAIAPLPH